MKHEPPHPERRDFLKTTTAALGVVSAFPVIIRAQTVTNAIKVGLVGCGGRGSGAGSQALQADDYAELTAGGDIDPAEIDRRLGALERDNKKGRRVKGGALAENLGLGAVQEGVDVQ